MEEMEKTVEKMGKNRKRDDDEIDIVILAGPTKAKVVNGCAHTARKLLHS